MIKRVFLGVGGFLLCHIWGKAIGTKMKKQAVLLWGNGKVLKENILWIRQLYDVKGITGKSVVETDLSEGLFTIDQALKINYDKIMITSMYYDEIRDELIGYYHINRDDIIFFLDEFNVEKRISFGTKNKGVTMYIGRVSYAIHKNGFMNFLEGVFYVYDYCYKKGYELLIDMKNYYTSYAGEKYGKVNIWEEYFMQPSKYSLDEAYESEDVIIGNITVEEMNSFSWKEAYKKWIDNYIFLGKMHGEKFIHSLTLRERINREITRIKLEEKRILGVIARGTDYVVLKPQQHPIPCPCDRYIRCIKSYMRYNDYKYIYLATEDLDVFNYFVKEFDKETLLFSDQKRISLNEHKLLMDIKLYEEDDGYMRGMDYNLVVAMLAKCDALIANCLCGAVGGALMLNRGKYSHIEIIDEGIYE